MKGTGKVPSTKLYRHFIMEPKMDQLVYRLYDLTEEEIKLIEESVGK